MRWTQHLPTELSCRYVRRIGELRLRQRRGLSDTGNARRVAFLGPCRRVAAARPAGMPVARRAFTIAELLFAISAIAALSILAMSVIALLMTAEQHSAEALWVDVTVANFAADLREDAHDAVDVELRADEQGQSAQVTLVQPEQVRVTYECTAEGVVRRKQQQGDLRVTETYRLAFGSSGFEFSGEDSLLRWQHLREIPMVGGFSEPAADEAAPRRLYQITAAVGLHAAISAEDDK